MNDLKQWADQRMGKPAPAAEPAEEFPPVPPGVEDVTVDELLADPDLPPEMRAWLERYRVEGIAFAEAENPPAFATNAGCWDKAKRAAGHAGASDLYAFSNWFYHQHC